MDRYTKILAEAYTEIGRNVVVSRPSDALSSRVSQRQLRKFVAYIEQLILFPVIVLFRHSRDMWHLSDHSDAIWLAFLPRHRSIVTCHDLIAIRAAKGELAEHFPRWSGRIYQRLVERGLSRAELLVAVSDATARDARRLLPGTKVVTIHNPLGPAFANSAAAADANGSRVRWRYLVLVSSSGWRKRRGHAVRAWALANAAVSYDLGLVIVGPPLSPEERTIVPVHQEDLITVHQSISDDLLARVYADALAVLQLSKYEGFGWPIIEANSQGTPAICADFEVFREVGEGAVFVGERLEDVNWADVIDVVCRDSTRQAAAINAKRFDAAGFREALGRLAITVGEGD